MKTPSAQSLTHVTTRVTAILFGLVAGAPAQSLAHPLVLVSDIDDTVKLTHVESKASAVVNGIWGDEAFAGMATLYQELIGASQQNELVFMSGSPSFLKDSIEEALVEENGFPEATFILRNWFKSGGIQSFKDQALAKLAKEKALPFILVGDDTEHDPEIFLRFAQTQPAGRVLGIYIRRNNHRALPAGVTGIYSAFDIALAELEAGRLSAQQAIRVVQSQMSTEDFELLFPDYAYCPELEYQNIPVGAEAQKSPSLMMAKKRLERFVTLGCHERD